MKKLIILGLLIVFSCSKQEKCSSIEEVIGKYENDYEIGATNILTLNNDGTFNQLYKKGKIIKNNTGTWKFFKIDCSIDFVTLKLLHKLPKQSREESVEGKPAKYRNNKIMFYEDMPFEYDYKKIK